MNRCNSGTDLHSRHSQNYLLPTTCRDFQGRLRQRYRSLSLDRHRTTRCQQMQLHNTLTSRRRTTSHWSETATYSLGALACRRTTRRTRQHRTTSPKKLRRTRLRRLSRARDFRRWTTLSRRLTFPRRTLADLHDQYLRTATHSVASQELPSTVP